MIDDREPGYTKKFLDSWINMRNQALRDKEFDHEDIKMTC